MMHMHLLLRVEGDDDRSMGMDATPHSGRRARAVRRLVLATLAMLVPVAVFSGISFIRHRQTAQLLWFVATLLVGAVAPLLLRRLKGLRAMKGQLQQTREELEHRVFHDSLTGLSNRTMFIQELTRSIARSELEGTSLSVLYLDLDGFKGVNDTLGHDAGDQMLVKVASHLSQSVRQVDSLARLGGDEFGVLVHESLESATRTAERLVKLFDGDWATAGGLVPVTVSIGVTSRKDEQLDELLNQADAAMYAAKAAGKGRWRAYSPKMGSVATVTDPVHTDLERAMDAQELVVHYQPIVELGSGKLTGVEALVRWDHPVRGLLLPSEFLGHAEDSGQIVAIDRWVMQRACEQVRRWQRGVPGAEQLAVHVNLSAAQLEHPGLAQQVGEVLRTSGLAPKHLVLEITETSLVRDADTAALELARLKALRVQLALDDFGTGFSSLSHLLRFPIDIIKIDRSFVAALIVGGRLPALALALVSFGKTLGLCVIAEGIEEKPQLELLRGLECEEGQGNYFSEPLSAPVLERMLLSGGLFGPARRYGPVSSSAVVVTTRSVAMSAGARSS
jgi:diguanylate cyclase (GGDEF)-like protein